VAEEITVAKKKSTRNRTRRADGDVVKRPRRQRAAIVRLVDSEADISLEPAATKSASPARQFSLHEIGDVAGEVWKTLADENGQALAAVKKKVAAPADLVAAAIGWLAREDKIEFNNTGRSVTVWLR
jgi:hypothetical protein